MADPKESFITQKDFAITEIDKASSQKSNILILANNFSQLVKFLSVMKAYVIYLRSLVDTENIVQTVIEYLQSSKTSISILYSLLVGSSEQQQINNIIYKVERLDSYTIEITNLSKPSWSVDKLIIQVKNVDGVIVYPTITTKNGKITVYFNDGIITNYNVIFI